MEAEYIEDVNGMQIFQQDKALIDLQISTAKAYPRDLARCISNAITMATMDKETAESCIFTIKKGGKAITGPSVNLAKIIIQEMGNMRLDNRVVGTDATHVTSEAVCFDLEKNIAIRTQVKRSIVGSNGRYGEDMITITGNAANAIALRNAIFAVIPVLIVKKVSNAAKQMILGDISDETKLIKRRTVVIDALLSTYSVQKLTEGEIISFCGKLSVAHIKEDDILALIGLEKSLQSGDIDFDVAFKRIKEQPHIKDKANERLLKLLRGALTLEELKKYEGNLETNEHRTVYDEMIKKLKK